MKSVTRDATYGNHLCDSSSLATDDGSSAKLASDSVPVATPEQAAEKATNPWVLLKVKALGELMPEAGLKLEELIDEGRMPREISLFLLQDHHVRLSELEVGRYSAWLPRIRRDAIRRKEQESELLVREAKERMKRRPR